MGFFKTGPCLKVDIWGMSIAKINCLGDIISGLGYG